jgi:hypothetical protein
MPKNHVHDPLAQIGIGDLPFKGGLCACIVFSFCRERIAGSLDSSSAWMKL